MPIKHFLQFKDFTRDELDYLFARTRWIKTEFKLTAAIGPWPTARW